MSYTNKAHSIGQQQYIIILIRIVKKSMQFLVIPLSIFHSL